MPTTSNNHQTGSSKNDNSESENSIDDYKNSATEELTVNLIRQKLDSIFDEGPSAKEEIIEIKKDHVHLSKHQKYMDSLSRSGMPLAEIQSAWHNYYAELPDNEKHEIWKEFYESQGQLPADHVSNNTRHHAISNQHNLHHIESRNTADYRSRNTHQKADIRHRASQKIIQRIINPLRKSDKKKHHRKSLLFGLGMGGISVVVMMFGFFNERFIAPFITPSKVVNSTPIIIDSNTAVGPEPRIIIPKINVDIPVVYNEPSIDEKAVQKSLENGALHYGITAKPGEKGNTVIFGHSSNNILNSGKYKFAFVLLNRLDTGDTFMIHKDGVRYVYKVYEKKIVRPDDISVLNPSDKAAVATLITCDPPGTSINRLVVIGEQISPEPNNNVASSVDANTYSQPAILPSNAPSLWQRFIDWLMN